MVFPYMAHDLAGLLENRKIERLEAPLLKLYARQLLEGTSYLHLVSSSACGECAWHLLLHNLVSCWSAE